MADLVVCFTGCAGAEEVWVSVFVTGLPKQVCRKQQILQVYIQYDICYIFVISVG